MKFVSKIRLTLLLALLSGSVSANPTWFGQDPAEPPAAGTPAQEKQPDSAPPANAASGTQAENPPTPAGADSAAPNVPNPSTPQENPPVEQKTLESLLDEFRANDALLAEKETEFKNATDDIRKGDIRTEYVALLNKTDQLISDLRVAALERVQANPGDVALQKTLLGVLMQEAQNRHDEEVLATGDILIAAQIDRKLLETAASASRLSIPAKEIFEEILLRQQDATANLPRARITTSKGVVEIELFEDQAPNTVANFVELATKKFYDGIKFHRVIEGFMAQTGDPQGTGAGGPGYTIACECYSPEARRHFTGSVSMAKTPARDSGGSQFFIVFERSDAVQQLDGKHTVFGRVISGMDVIRALNITSKSDVTGETPIAGVTPDIMQTVEITRKREHPYEAVKIGETPAPTPTPPATQPPGEAPQKDALTPQAPDDAAKDTSDGTDKSGG